MIFDKVKTSGLKRTLEDIEKEVLLKALDSESWVIAKAARLIGIKRTTMIEKMRRYGIHRSKDIGVC